MELPEILQGLDLASSPERGRGRTATLILSIATEREREREREIYRDDGAEAREENGIRGEQKRRARGREEDEEDRDEVDVNKTMPTFVWCLC
ncbi:hypothetical protein Scep_022834 [Stephania cephalantha]|uniref:Uncharacterized protein n=1 Tax=Stephania cephalantha TaxID=152367 RepID=A0AAP0I2K1_9MAGN